MGMNILGSAGSYARTKMLRVQWGQKLRSGNVTDASGPADEGDSPGETARKERLQSIRDKMDAGEPLSVSEREFLKANDPQAYADLEAEEAEQRAYEEELKRCRTKQDVQRLRTRWLGASMSRMRAAEHNPNVSPERKKETFAQEKRRMDRVEASTKAFVKIGAYARLPDEGEKAREDAKKAAERTERARKRMEEAAKRTEKDRERKEETVKQTEKSRERKEKAIKQSEKVREQRAQTTRRERAMDEAKAFKREEFALLEHERRTLDLEA